VRAEWGVERGERRVVRGELKVVREEGGGARCVGVLVNGSQTGQEDVASQRYTVHQQILPLNFQNLEMPEPATQADACFKDLESIVRGYATQWGTLRTLIDRRPDNDRVFISSKYSPISGTPPFTGPWVPQRTQQYPLMPSLLPSFRFCLPKSPHRKFSEVGPKVKFRGGALSERGFSAGAV